MTEIRWCSMRVKKIIDEDFVNYKKPSMFIGTISCSGKCCIEANLPLSVCQNDGWRSCAPIPMANETICRRYLENPITEAIVFGGLEPFEQLFELIEFMATLRDKFSCNDEVVIYTGYTREEIRREVDYLAAHYNNIIIKFGRFVPNQEPHCDPILGINLASDNQYAEKIS